MGSVVRTVVVEVINNLFKLNLARVLQKIFLKAGLFCNR
jgi:hypothetical protein